MAFLSTGFLVGLSIFTYGVEQEKYKFLVAAIAPAITIIPVVICATGSLYGGLAGLILGSFSRGKLCDALWDLTRIFQWLMGPNLCSRGMLF